LLPLSRRINRRTTVPIPAYSCGCCCGCAFRNPFGKSKQHGRICFGDIRFLCRWAYAECLQRRVVYR
jgi:hypothetical protein